MRKLKGQEFGTRILRFDDVRINLHREVDIDRTSRLVARWKRRVLQFPLVVIDVVLRLIPRIVPFEAEQFL